jgi:hypothetical protein
MTFLIATTGHEEPVHIGEIKTVDDKQNINIIIWMDGE